MVNFKLLTLKSKLKNLINQKTEEGQSPESVKRSKKVTQLNRIKSKRNVFGVCLLEPETGFYSDGKIIIKQREVEEKFEKLKYANRLYGERVALRVWSGIIAKGAKKIKFIGADSGLSYYVNPQNKTEQFAVHTQQLKLIMHVTGADIVKYQPHASPPVFIIYKKNMANRQLRPVAAVTETVDFTEIDPEIAELALEINTIEYDMSKTKGE